MDWKRQSQVNFRHTALCKPFIIMTGKSETGENGRSIRASEPRIVEFSRNLSNK